VHKAPEFFIFKVTEETYCKIWHPYLREFLIKENSRSNIVEAKCS
jgi:hypothetical protein